MNNRIAEQDKNMFKEKIIINTTKRFIEVKHYLDWYCDRYGGYYDLPLYGPVFIQDNSGNKCETAWFVQPDISDYRFRGICMTLSKAEKDAIDKLQSFCREYGYMAAGTLDHEYIYLYPKFNGGDPYILPLNAVDYFLARNMTVTTVEPTVSFEELYKKDVTTIGP